VKFLSFPSRLLHWMLLTRPIRFTRFGTFYILFSIGVGAAAINTGNNLLYLILGILLGFIILSGFLSDSCLWGIHTEWTPKGSFYVEEKASFICHVEKGWFPGVAISVESQWHGRPSLRTMIPWISARGTVDVAVDLVPEQRGPLTLERCLYTTYFPFGLFQKSHTRVMQERWIVYPKIKRLPRNLMESQGDHLSSAATSQPGMGSLPYILRDYREGDALRQVQWKATAKRQRLIVKETEQEANEGDLFVLEAWPTDLNGAQMERFFSFIASLVFTAHETGRPVGLAAPGNVFPPEHSRRQLHEIFKYLALVEPNEAHGSQTSPKRLPMYAHRMDVRSLWKTYAAQY
jgi:uncharacterized protein (DUF58 family)